LALAPFHALVPLNFRERISRCRANKDELTLRNSTRRKTV